MKNWFVWAGISFIIGGMLSFALNLGTTNYFDTDDSSGYAIGWILVGVFLITIGYIKKKTNLKI